MNVDYTFITFIFMLPSEALEKKKIGNFNINS